MSLTVIIPVHEINDSVKEYLSNAIKSVIEQKYYDEVRKVMVVLPPSIETDVKEFVDALKEDTIELIYCINEGATDFQSQVNKGAEKCDTQYFTILEFDDEISLTFYKNADKHITYFTDVDLFLPIMVEVNQNSQVEKMTNETVWSKSFVGENGVMGYLNTDALNAYTDFKISGAIFKTSEYVGLGGLKKNIKLTFQYEFLLRMLSNGMKIYTIPKISYKHLNMRDGGLFHTYANTMNMEERKFWFDVAKRESNFPSDREIDTSLLSVK
jgi:hypothetical protein